MPATVAPTIGMNAPMKTMTASGQRERHAQDGEADADAGGVDEGDDGRAAHVAAERLHRGGADALSALEAAAAERTQEERPDAVAVLEEEEQHDDGEQRAGDELGGDGDAGDGAGPELAAGEEVGDAVLEAVELVLVDRQRAALQEVADGVDALGGRLRELVPLAAHGEHDERDDAAEDDDAADQGDPGRDDGRQAATAHPADDGGEGRREDERDQHGDDDELQLHEAPHEHGRQRQGQQDLPAPDADLAEAVGEE